MSEPSGGVRLVVSYDGTEFAGWQRQPAQRTVQGELERAATILDGAPVKMRGASRTDSGVHAVGQSVGFDAVRPIPALGWVRGLNGKLPSDVAVSAAYPAAIGYDPRFDSIGKTYRYRLHVDLTRDPILARRAWHLGPRRSKPQPGGPRTAADILDLEGMRAAAPRLLGTHDFGAFQAAGDPRDNTVRTLFDVRIEDALPDVYIVVHGNAFLQHMVRILVGTLIEVGRQRMSPDEVSALLEHPERQNAGETAPPWGLYLMEVHLGRLRAQQA